MYDKSIGIIAFWSISSRGIKNPLFLARVLNYIKERSTFLLLSLYHKAFMFQLEINLLFAIIPIISNSLRPCSIIKQRITTI